MYFLLKNIELSLLNILGPTFRPNQYPALSPATAANGRKNNKLPERQETGGGQKSRRESRRISRQKETEEKSALGKDDGDES